MKPVVLIILDGWGYREEKEHNAIAQAHTPFFDYLWKNYPRSLLQASGAAVGLPDGQIGNSEVGHTTIGAGTVLDTDLVRINKAAAQGEFKHNPAFKKLFQHVNQHNSLLHVKGLISPGGVHSHIDHLYHFLCASKDYGLKQVAVHAFLDGRDTPPQSAGQYLREAEDMMAKLGIGFIASMSGRYYAMDRDDNWDRLAQATDMFFQGKASRVFQGRPSRAVRNFYEQNITDEFVQPSLFMDKDKNYPVRRDDAVLFLNFRADRARMLSTKILQRAAQENICFVSMTQYDKNFNNDVAFTPLRPQATLAGEISQAGLKQVHIAETEKFAHATYFLNGGRQQPHAGEEHVMIVSRKDIATHDQAPEMRAQAIANKGIEHINKKTDFIFINFANPDMVGHTGRAEAVVKAVEQVDEQLKRVVQAVRQVQGTVIVSADHGNAEINFDTTSQSPHTAHTTNPVPAIMVGQAENLRQGSLCDLAPTVLQALGLVGAEHMTGRSLF